MVLLGLVVDDLDVLSLANHSGDLFQGDIAALVGIIEFAIPVAFDHPDSARREVFLLSAPHASVLP